MTDPRAELFAKIQALLTLADASRNPSEAEAAAAMAAAQRLMAKHQIDMAAVDGFSAEAEDLIAESAEDAILDDTLGRNLPGWRSNLATSLGTIHGCRVYQRQVRTPEGIRVRLQIIGAASDASLVRYLYVYAARQIDDLCESERTRLGASGKTWGANFRLACGARVCERVRESAKTAKAEAAAGAPGSALVRLDDRSDRLAREIQDHGKRLGLRTVRRSGPRHDSHARDAGRKAGDRVDLSGGGRGGALGAGARGALR